MIHARITVVVVVFLASFACEHRSSSPSSTGRPSDVRNVSLIELIANPEDYEGDRVRVEGFGNIEFEYMGLTLNPEDSEYLITKNGVGLDLSSEQFREHQHLNERFLRVEGRFTITPSRSYDLWSARLEDVSKIEAIPTKSELRDLAKSQQ